VDRYEPAGGVCKFEWRSGFPDSNQEFGDILVETWAISLSFYNHPAVSARARVRAMRYDYNQKKWLLTGGDEYVESKHGKARRWCRLPCGNAHISIRVSDW